MLIFAENILGLFTDDRQLIANSILYLTPIAISAVIFDPIHRLNQSDLSEEFAISRQILKEFSPRASYARVVNLNVTHLIIPLS